MDSLFVKSALIKNSESESYSFYLVDRKTINCDFFNDKGEYTKSIPVTDEELLDYDVDIDNNNIIHLLCLTKEGNLAYHIYRNEKWSSHVITKFDVRSNKYNNLTLKVVRKRIHIFYSVSNMLNHNLWTIKHVSSDNRKWNKGNIISITPGKTTDPFYVTFDKTGGIHLVYMDIDKGNHHIYYTSYNTFLQRWNRSPEKLSENNTDNFAPFIFIDNNNSIHVAWSSKSNNTTQLVYKQMSILSNSKHTWKKYELPHLGGNCFSPIIMQDNGLLKLVYNQNKSLKCLLSSNHGYTWSLENSNTSIRFQDLSIIKFSSNYYYDKFKMKIEYIYGDVRNNIDLYYCDSYKNITKAQSSNSDFNTYYDSKDKTDTDILSQEKKQDENNNSMDSVEYNVEPSSNKDEHKTQELSKPILEEIDNFENDTVKEFIETFKIKLDELVTNAVILSEQAKKIEEIVLSNIKGLDKKIHSNKKFTNEIKNSLVSLEKVLEKHKTYNDDISELLSSIKEINDKNVVEVKNVESKLERINALIEDIAAPNLLERILKIFK